MQSEQRQKLRREKIAARDGYSAGERNVRSRKIVENILTSTEFQKAERILIYRGIRGEVRLNLLETAEEAKGKQFLFPLCLPNHEMAALMPRNKDAWTKGYAGIEEPVPEMSVAVLPEDIDFVICPCTAFDAECSRMGMGGGFYDRFLPKCRNAVIAAAAFEVQRVESVPTEPWDRAVDLVFTEEKVYRKG